MHKDIIKYYIKIASVFAVLLAAVFCLAFFSMKGSSIGTEDGGESKERDFKINYESFYVSRPDFPESVPIQGQRNDPLLIIVSEKTPLPDGYNVQLAEVEGMKVDARAAQNLKEMFAKAKEDGIQLLICSGFRSVELQRQLFDDKVQRVESSGKNREEAIETAKTEVAYPGTSEHHTGLAVDIVAFDHQELDSEFGNTPEGKWLAENAQDYGFVLRYPKDKENVTGIIFEPWHYRFVGIENAEKMKENDLCLEEYIQNGYLIA